MLLVYETKSHYFYICYRKHMSSINIED